MCEFIDQIRIVETNNELAWIFSLKAVRANILSKFEFLWRILTNLHLFHLVFRSKLINKNIIHFNFYTSI